MQAGLRPSNPRRHQSSPTGATLHGRAVSEIVGFLLDLVIADLIARLPEYGCVKLPSRQSTRRQTFELEVDDRAFAYIGRTHG